MRVFPAHSRASQPFPRSDGRGSLRAVDLPRATRPKGATEKKSAWLASAPAAYVMPMGNVSAREESQTGRRAERAWSQATSAQEYTGSYLCTVYVCTRKEDGLRSTALARTFSLRVTLNSLHQTLYASTFIKLRYNFSIVSVCADFLTPIRMYSNLGVTHYALKSFLLRLREKECLKTTQALTGVFNKV